MLRIFAIVFTLIIVAFPVAAQVLSAPQDVINCLCADRAVKMLGEEVAARSRFYDDARQQLNELEVDLQRRRQTMNANDPAQVDAYRQRFDRREEISKRLSGELTADYRSAVERYNQAVADYNNTCSGRTLDAGVVASVTPTLNCPIPGSATR